MNPLTSLTLLGLSTVALQPMGGVAWVPAGRDDILWISESRGSGTAMGEMDGLIRPSLSAHVGIRFEKCALFGGFSMARVTSTTYTTESRSQNHVGTARLSADYRRYLQKSETHRVIPYLEGGIYGLIPSARDISDSYTEAEQAAADESAKGTRETVRGLGLELGPGFSYSLKGGLSVGARSRLVLYGSWHSQETSTTLSTMIYPEVALIMEATFP